MNFVAIDFETANRDPASACSLGLVVVQAGQIIENKQWLIQPPTLSFDYRHIKTHGITPDIVKNAPVFIDIWDDVKPHLLNSVVTAHNAPFDINVLHNAANIYGLALPPFKALCTVELSRKAWPHLKNHKLSTVASLLGVELDHHNSSSDALACAKIALSACDCLNLKHIHDCFKFLNIQAEIETFDYERNFWNEQEFEIHFTEDQVKRQKSAIKVCLESINMEKEMAVINGYNVTLTSCNCRDFAMRQLPCKHMYKLAQELNIFDTSGISKKKDAKKYNQTYKLEEILYNAISKHTNDLLSGKIQKDEFIASILRVISSPKING